ncbi:MAG: hypothetical protein P8Y37_09345 [Anaerolineales bacterium]
MDKRVDSGQLNNTGLTLKDLKTIIDSFTATLKGTYHARVEYPDEDENGETEVDSSGTAATTAEKKD